jgi:hypothetical protein
VLIEGICGKDSTLEKPGVVGAALERVIALSQDMFPLPADR